LKTCFHWGSISSKRRWCFLQNDPEFKQNEKSGDCQQNKEGQSAVKGFEGLDVVLKLFPVRQTGQKQLSEYNHPDL
jgi:hypothetical protein